MIRAARKLSVLLLVLMLLVGLLPVGAFAAESTGAEVKGRVLHLGADLTLRLYTSIEDAYKTDGVVTVSVGNQVKNTYNVNEMTAGENGYYEFCANFAAAQITETITLRLVSGGNEVYTYETTAKDYLEDLLQYETATASDKRLALQLMTYGAAAQQYFGYKEDTLANAGYELTSQVTVPEALSLVIEGSVDGVSFYGASMLLQDVVSLRLYFNVPGGDVSGYTFKVDGEECTPTAKSGMYKIDVPCNDPHKMDVARVITVTDGSGNTLTVEYSPMNYISRMYAANKDNAESAALCNMLLAATGYFEEAKTYTGAQPVYVDKRDSGNIAFTLSSAEQAQVSGKTLAGATVNSTAFTTATYANGVVTLDRATVSALSGKQTVVLNFGDVTLDVTAYICEMVIETTDDLVAFPTISKNALSGYYVLGANIDMDGISFANTNGDGYEFTGTFDGRGYTVSNFCTKSSATDWAGGLFGKHFNGTLKDVSFVDAIVKGQGSFLACKGNGGTLENVYMRVIIDGLVSSYTTNGWVNNTSVLFSTTPASAIQVNNVILEYAEPLTDNNGWGYAFGYSNDGTVVPNGFYIIGADGVGNSGGKATACYESEAAFDADVVSWDGNGFWSVLNGFPTPNGLAGVKYDSTLNSNAVGYIGENNTGDTFTLDLSDVKAQLSGAALKDVTVDGASFATKSYVGGVVTLDKATAGTLTGETAIVLTFETSRKNITVNAKINTATYTISTPAEMANFPTVMAENLAGTYVLTNDIDMYGVSYTNANTAANFTGTFDGQGYTIYNMTSKTAADDWDGGFFGKLFAGTLKNVSFANATVKGQGAFLAFRSIAGKLENVYMSVAFDGLVSDGSWINDTSVLFNDGNGNYLYTTNVVIEYAETLTASAGFAVYQNFSMTGINGLYVIGADSISVATLSGSSTAYGCYTDRAAFNADVSAWDGNGFWTVVDGFPIPNRLVGTVYANGYVVENALDMTASAYVGAQNTEETFTVDFSAQNEEVAGMTFVSAVLNGRTFETASYNTYTGILTLDRATVGTLSESQTVKLTFTKDGAVYVAYAELKPADMVFYNAAQLQTFPTLMAANPAGTYALGCNINFAGYTYENTMTDAFTGVFDGQGYCISNMATKTAYNDWDGGFFGKMFKGTLKNVSFVKATVRGQGAFLAFRNNAGTMENVYLNVSFDEMVSGLGWINDTSVLFNDGEGNYLYATNVIVEYAEPLTGASAGYPFYQNLSVSKFNGLYVIGADSISVATLSGSSTAYGCYDDRAALAGESIDFSSWYTTGFWTSDANNTPVPSRLPEKEKITITLDDTAVVGLKNTGDLVLDLSDIQEQLAEATLVDVTVDGVSFATKSYADGMLTLDRASLGETTGDKTVAAVFENTDQQITVYVPVTAYTYTVGTSAELAAFPTVMASNLDGTYVLTGDIDMAGVSYTNSCTSAFIGTFDGQGYTIYNMASKTSTTQWDGGFFGKLFGTENVANAATLKNISFVNATVKGQGAFLACKGNGTLENVYMQVAIEGLVSNYTDNGWINNTSVLFNQGQGNLAMTKVVVEYAETLADNNGWGYPIGSNNTMSTWNGFYVIGADNYYNSTSGTTAPAAGLYADRGAFDADVSAWNGNGFWTVVDGFPVPNRLVGVKIPFAVSSDAVGYFGEKNESTTFTVDLSDVKDRLTGTSLKDVTVNGTSFATKTYADGILTLDKATASGLTGEQEIVITFENASMTISVSAKVSAVTYTISTPAEMANFPTVMAENLAGTYVLTNDIDMYGVSYTNANTAANFTGTFDGQGYTIYNMTSKTAADDWDGGFFGKLFAGTLKNVSFANATVKGQGAFLAFRSIAGKLENVYMSVAFDGLVSDGSWINDTSVLFNDGNGNYLYTTNVVIEYAETLTASAGFAVYQNFSMTGINGLYVIGADSISVATLSGSSTAYGCYTDRAAFNADVSAWDGNGFWTVVDGFPIPNRLVGTIYEDGYVAEIELDMTASTYVGTNNTEETFTVDFRSQRLKTLGMTFAGATVGGKSFETATYNFNTGILTLDKATVGTLTENQTVKLTFTKDGAVYVANAELKPADMVFYTAAQLQTFPTLMAAKPAGTYALGNNIDFAGYTYENTMTDAFTGTFDGQGYAISNMATKTSYSDWDGGLFGKMFQGTLKNISFPNATVKGQGAFLAFRGNSSTLENVYIEATFDSMDDTNSFTAASSVLYNDCQGDYIYANNVIIEYAESLTATYGGYAIFQSASISKFNGLYIIGANKVSPATLNGSSTAYGCYDDRAALADANIDFSTWYATGIWVTDTNNTPVAASVFAAAQDALYKEQTAVSGTIHNVGVTTNTTRKFIQGGASDYKIIVDETNTADKAAADIIIKYLARSGVTLPIVTADQYSDDGKFIVINNDTLFAGAGLTVLEDLGVSGYVIKTVGDNVFLQSGGVEGIQYAAAAFLKHTLGLRTYGTADMINNVAGQWAWMPDFNITEKPDIDTHIMGNWRDSANADVQYLMGYTDYADYFLMSADSDGNGVYDHGTENHTSMNYLPKNTYWSLTNGNWKWFSGESQWESIINVPDQLCYTAHGDSAELEEMIQTAAEQMLVRIKAQPTAIAGQFSVSDTHSACTCSTCTASYNTYGTHAAAVIQFTNKLNTKLRELMAADAETADREFTLYLMAYHEYAIAPVTKNADGSYSPIDDSVICDEGVGVLYAPIEAMYTYDLYSNINNDIAENMEMWASLSDHMYYWLYETQFKNYFVPFGSWRASALNMRHSYLNNADIVMIQGQHNTKASSGFTTLKVYLNAAFAQNVNADYDALVDAFFTEYYGAAGDTMRQIFDELEAWLNDLAVYHPNLFNGFIANEGQEAAAYWPEELLLHWQALLEQAETEAAGSATALNHITDESMFVRYLLITQYGYSNLAADFNTDAAARGFTYLSESETLGTLS